MLLSLLTKIENAEFSKIKELKISAYLKKLIEESEELIAIKEIKLTSDVDKEVKIKMDATLAEILFSNLYQNSIKHNIKNGSIKIILSENSFIIENTVEIPQNSPSLFFQRFKKNNQSSESLGLGLSIVKKICDISGFTITYDFDQESRVHRIHIDF